MRVIRLTVALAALVVGAPGVAVAGPPVGGGPSPTPPPQPGPTTVHYRNGSGGLSSTTSIPFGSAFRSQGGSDRSPCTFTWYPDADGDGSTDPDGRPEQRESMRWLFRETTDQVLDDVDWSGLSSLSGAEIETLVAGYGPVEAAVRRFDVLCVGTQGSGQVTNDALGSVQVGVVDPFWGVFTGVARVWAGVQLDRPRVGTVPSSDLFGGLPVNMPASFQIDAGTWSAYASPPVDFRGWSARLLLTPSALEFDAVFDPDDGSAAAVTVPCVSGFADLPDAGMVPRRDPGVPDFAEPGQFEAPCVWIPPAPGELTVTARMTYRVVYVVSGFAQELAPYSWSSAPLTLRVDELRVVNIRPDD